MREKQTRRLPGGEELVTFEIAEVDPFNGDPRGQSLERRRDALIQHENEELRKRPQDSAPRTEGVDVLPRFLNPWPMPGVDSGPEPLEASRRRSKGADDAHPFDPTDLA
jgi:hypothetical protein